VNSLAQRLLEQTHRRPLVESEAVKEMAKKSRAVLKNVISLFQMYRGDDPHLQSKEAKICMQAVLQHAVGSTVENPELFRFGRPAWEPDPLAWVSFFDEVGDRTLADFLNISSASEIPAADDMTGQIDNLPEDGPDHRRTDTPEDSPVSRSPGARRPIGDVSDAALADSNLGDV